MVLVLEPEQAFTPGVYTLEVEITNPFTGEVTTQSQEFAWGVLAMNPDKDRYHPGETAHIAIGVLMTTVRWCVMPPFICTWKVRTDRAATCGLRMARW